MENGFLAQFLRMRESLNRDDHSKSSNNNHSNHSTQKQKKNVTVATIIEELPPKSTVLEYLRNRIADMEESDVEE